MELEIEFKANERFAEVTHYRLLSPFATNIWAGEKRKVFITGDSMVMIDKKNADGSSAPYGRTKFLLNVYKKIDISFLHKTSTTEDMVQNATSSSLNYAPVQAAYDVERDFGHDLNKHDEYVTIYDKSYYERFACVHWKAHGLMEEIKHLKPPQRWHNGKMQDWPFITYIS